MKLTDEVKLKLLKLNMSQRDLAAALNVSYKMLNAFLNHSAVSLPIEIKLIQWLKKPETPR